MKERMVYNIVLAIAISLTVLVILYNLVWRETFAVLVRYDYPTIPAATQAAEIPTTVDIPASTAAEPQASEPLAVQFPLNINTAVYNELLLIPGVGDVTAQRIVQYREVLGGYTALEQLMDIQGIGEKTFAEIALYLYV